MTGYMKKFIYASLVYFIIASFIGIMYSTGHFSFFYRFVHVHLNLLGFMAMMVFGVGYFILPRFSGAELRWPDMLAVHFWLANIGLVGMCVAWVIKGGQQGTGIWNGLFLTFIMLEAVAVLLFVINIWATIASADTSTTETAHGNVQANSQAFISEQDIIGDVLKKYPATSDVFRQFYGAGCFSCPGQAYESIAQSAMMHSVDKDVVLEALNKAVSAAPTAVGQQINKEAIPSSKTDDTQYSSEKPMSTADIAGSSQECQVCDAPATPSDTAGQCFNCSAEEKDVTLIRFRKAGKTLYVCTRCIPVLIHE